MILRTIDSIGRIFISMITIFSYGELTKGTPQSITTTYVLGILLFIWTIVPVLEIFIKRWKELNEPEETKIDTYNGQKRKSKK